MMDGLSAQRTPFSEIKEVACRPRDKRGSGGADDPVSFFKAAGGLA
jgi:hypothetical protein